MQVIVWSGTKEMGKRDKELDDKWKGAFFLGGVLWLKSDAYNILEYLLMKVDFDSN